MRRLAQLALALGFTVGLCGALGLALFQGLVLRDLPELYSLTDYRPSLVTEVRDREGTIFARFYRERREVVPIEQIPDYVVHAFVAAEDDSFYEHEGLDYPGILRAAWANLRAGGIRQGGSTITQQVAKTFLLSNERSYVRKLKDMVLAKRIEEHLNKNEILYLYLNQIYLGSGAYGVQAAARSYFGKPVEELTVAEAALIAGVVPAPSRYTPFRNPDAARARQRFVLRRMVEEGYISDDDQSAALEEKTELLELAPDEMRAATAYFAEDVRRYLVESLGEEVVLTGGLQVTTTLNLEHQKDAYDALRNGLRDHDRRTGFRGPVRVVPKEEHDDLMVELAETNGPPPWTDGSVLQALVVQVDNERQLARLALGGGLETLLTLEDVGWARPPDPEVDGLDYKIDRVSRALKRGHLVELEKVGLFEPEPEHPAAEVLAGDEGAAERLAAEEGSIPQFVLFQKPLAEGALLAMDVATGHVTAMMGGYSFARSQFNRANQSKRQPGSAFKPIVYAAAMQQGYTPATIVYDTPLVYEDRESGVTWKPGNYSDRFYGPITLREALARSRNIATIRIMRDIGIPPVVDMARAVGIDSHLERDLAMSLGASEVTLAELVGAYSTFAAAGRQVEAVFILEVRDRDGNLLAENVPLSGWEEQIDRADTIVEGQVKDERADAAMDLDGVLQGIFASAENGDRTLPEGYAVDPIIAYLMTDLLQAVVQEGTGWRARALRRPLAGKTGTTNDMHDAWFLGYSPSLVTGVWVGYDVARSLGKNEAGSRAASPIWVDYMGRVLQGTRRENFRAPSDIVFARIDKKTGLLAAPGSSEFVFQPFREGTAPTEFAPEQKAARTRIRLD